MKIGQIAAMSAGGQAAMALDWASSKDKDGADAMVFVGSEVLFSAPASEDLRVAAAAFAGLCPTDRLRAEAWCELFRARRERVRG